MLVLRIELSFESQYSSWKLEGSQIPSITVRFIYSWSFEKITAKMLFYFDQFYLPFIFLLPDHYLPLTILNGEKGRKKDREGKENGGR